MQLSRQEFEDRYQAGHLRLAFIGMSNIGKSYTAMRLATEYKMHLLEVDKIIWERLGQSSMDDFAAWQGQPYSAGYQEREQESIWLENEATDQAITQALAISLKTPIFNPILDTTGSIIYTQPATLERLKFEFYIIYIKASQQAVERLKVQYFKQPKPLIWAGHYQDIPGKTPDQSILECYPDLLAARAKDYAALADHSLCSDFILNPDVKISDIFTALQPA